ncbi:MAG: type IV pilus assembly protein PilM [bacterium]
MFFFKKKSKTYLGIDIGASAIKLAELEKQEERYRLKNYAIFSLDKYLEKNDYQINSESPKISNQEMADIIKSMIKSINVKSKDVCFSVPVYSSFSTLIDFPNMSEKEIASAIPFEARKHIPVPVSEVILDWSIVSPLGQKEGQQVLLIAVLKKVVNNYSKIAQLAGLSIKTIEEETFSLSRALVGNDKSTIVLIDAGARSIGVSIIDNGYIRVIHNLEMGGAKITKSIANELNFSAKKAEELKKNLSIGDGQKGNIHPSLSIIAIEIKKILDFYQSKYNRKIEKGIFVGDGIKMNNFTEYLADKLLIDVSIGDPFARIIYPPILKSTLKELSPSLAVVIGLTMQG